MLGKILMIDSNDSKTLALSEVLKNQGLCVDIANDASQLMELTREGNFDLIISLLDPTTEDNSYQFMELENYLLEKENSLLKTENSGLMEKLKRSYIYSMHSLVIALEEKDPYTAGHSERVAQYSVEIARELGMSEYIIDTIALAGLFHDIGKIGIKESILHKPGNLTDEEYDHIKRHPEIGKKILEPMLEQQEILNIVLYHHERYDGKGYPQGLSGDNIPLEAKILAVADAYDAMTSNRPYRIAMDKERAVGIVSENKGRQFDPIVADAFLRIC